MFRRRGPRSDSDQADEAHRLGPELRGRHPQMGRRDDGDLPRRHRVLAAAHRRLYRTKRVHRVRLHAVAEVQWWCVPALADQHRRHCKRRGRLGHELHVAHGRRVQRRDARRKAGRDNHPKARVLRRPGPGLPPDLHGVLATDLRVHVADLDDAHRLVRHGAGVLPRDALPLRLHGRLRELPDRDRAGGLPRRRRRLLQRGHARVPPDASAARAAGPDRPLPPPGARLGEVHGRGAVRVARDGLLRRDVAALRPRARRDAAGPRRVRRRVPARPGGAGAGARGGRRAGLGRRRRAGGARADRRAAPPHSPRELEVARGQLPASVAGLLGLAPVAAARRVGPGAVADAARRVAAARPPGLDLSLAPAGPSLRRRRRVQRRAARGRRRRRTSGRAAGAARRHPVPRHSHRRDLLARRTEAARPGPPRRRRAGDAHGHSRAVGIGQDDTTQSPGGPRGALWLEGDGAAPRDGVRRQGDAAVARLGGGAVAVLVLRDRSAPHGRADLRRAAAVLRPDDPSAERVDRGPPPARGGGGARDGPAGPRRHAGRPVVGGLVPATARGDPVAGLAVDSLSRRAHDGPGRRHGAGAHDGRGAVGATRLGGRRRRAPAGGGALRPLRPGHRRAARRRGLRRRLAASHLRRRRRAPSTTTQLGGEPSRRAARRRAPGQRDLRAAARLRIRRRSGREGDAGARRRRALPPDRGAQGGSLLPRERPGPGVWVSRDGHAAGAGARDAVRSRRRAAGAGVDGGRRRRRLHPVRGTYHVVWHLQFPGELRRVPHRVEALRAERGVAVRQPARALALRLRAGRARGHFRSDAVFSRDVRGLQNGWVRRGAARAVCGRVPAGAARVPRGGVAVLLREHAEGVGALWHRFLRSVQLYHLLAGRRRGAAGADAAVLAGHREALARGERDGADGVLPLRGPAVRLRRAGPSHHL
mmetsp:Transcript_6785/g.20097  ORF Transcript_6785/g.20097 Transcript_6785/m.20097 type:complete len:932 (-) Transcript_6785:368-3163(-)